MLDKETNSVPTLFHYSISVGRSQSERILEIRNGSVFFTFEKRSTLLIQKKLNIKQSEWQSLKKILELSGAGDWLEKYATNITRDRALYSLNIEWPDLKVATQILSKDAPSGWEEVKHLLGYYMN
jgi:hypothetical protein